MKLLFGLIYIFFILMLNFFKSLKSFNIICLITWFLSLAQFLWYVLVIVNDVITAAAVAATLVISRHNVSVFCILLHLCLRPIHEADSISDTHFTVKYLVFGREVHTQVVELEMETGQSNSKASEPLTIRMYLCIFIFICSIKDLNYYGQMYCRH